MARKSDGYFKKYFLYLSFTMIFACSSISISSTFSFTVLIIPFSLFPSLNSSYRPFSNADLQKCRSATCNKTQTTHPENRRMLFLRSMRFNVHMKIHEYSRTHCESTRNQKIRLLSGQNGIHVTHRWNLQYSALYIRKS